MNGVTHSDLVAAAAKWLENRCRIRCAEFCCMAVSEQPDAIGWTSAGQCIVVECKRSYSDYVANRRKGFERSGIGVGDQRYFLAPRGIIPVEKLYDGWGLLEYRPSNHPAGYYIKTMVRAPQNPVKLDGMRFQIERKMLVALAGRLMDAGIRAGISFVDPIDLETIYG